MSYSSSFSVIHQFAQFVTFSSVPAEFLSFVCISVRLIRHRVMQRCTTCGRTAACGLRYWNLRPSTI